MSVDIRKVKKLIELAKATGISELEIKEGEESIRITCSSQIKMPISADSICVKPELLEQKGDTIEARSAQVDENFGHTIKSPMVGTAYLSASPGAKPFVEIGQRVKAGEVICLIEAMKMFNRIESDKDGVVKTILVNNEQPVEYGQALFIIE